MPIKTNTKRSMKVRVPKSEITFVVGMLKRKNKTTISVRGQWITTTYNKRKPIF